MKFTAIKDEINGVLSMYELRSIKITDKTFLELKPSYFLALCSSCDSDINAKEQMGLFVQAMF